MLLSTTNIELSQLIDESLVPSKTDLPIYFKDFGKEIVVRFLQNMNASSHITSVPSQTLYDEGKSISSLSISRQRNKTFLSGVYSTPNSSTHLLGKE